MRHQSMSVGPDAVGARLRLPQGVGPRVRAFAYQACLLWLYRACLHCRTMADNPDTLLLATPRGYCAGVDRAVQTVEHALNLYGAPVYVRKEIVHNKHVVEQLRERGAIFVESETEVPEGSTVVFSAHGVAPSVHSNAAQRQLYTIDATCPLVTKVHVEAKKFAAEGYT